MAFRVETSLEAENDALSILEWLISKEAGDAGLRWFLAMEKMPSRHWRPFPSAVPWHRKFEVSV